MNFTEWWDQNKAVYIALNITREIAHTIWSAAADNMEIIMLKYL